jgi:hypothetical protein
MGFENKTTEELVKIAEAGLGFTLNIENFSAADIDRIAKAASFSGAQVIFINSNSKTIDTKV